MIKCNHVLWWKTCGVNRGSLPSKLPGRHQDDLQAAVQGVCAHIPLTFPDDSQAPGRSASQHLLQALHALHMGN